MEIAHCMVAEMWDCRRPEALGAGHSPALMEPEVFGPAEISFP